MGVALRVERGLTPNEALTQVGLAELDPTFLAQYCECCLKLRRAMVLANQRSYEMTAEDRGYPRRAHHTAHRLSNILENTTKKYKPEKWFGKHGIKGVLVGEEDKDEPWNSVYHPDVPEHGITIAISRTKDTV